MGVNEMARAMDVTPTAIRQRLTRLSGQDLITREAKRNGRGRPRHLYQLTDKGIRLTGSNFTDLALVLWREMTAIEDAQLRQELLPRVAKALASQYAGQVAGSTTTDRMKSLGDLLGKRRIPTSVENGSQKPTLTTHACPYPNLSERDESVCQMEQMLFSELLGERVSLTSCRLDGACECRFQAEEA
jgi:predicted ArsR family transcriptional regulator